MHQKSILRNRITQREANHRMLANEASNSNHQKLIVSRDPDSKDNNLSHVDGRRGTKYWDTEMIRYNEVAKSTEMKVLVAAAQMATVSICIQRWVSRSLWSGWNKWLEYDEWRQNKRSKTNQVQELFRRRDKLGSRLLLRSINCRSQEDYSIENVYIRKGSTLS